MSSATLNIEKRITELEDGGRARLICPECVASGETFLAWCDHMMPPPFDRFVQRSVERNLERKAVEVKPC